MRIITFMFNRPHVVEFSLRLRKPQFCRKKDLKTD